MFRNYLVVALRNLNRQKSFGALNILGLAIGLGTCILIALYIRDELSFDGWHTKGDRIYRVIRETRAGGQSDYLPFTSGALAGALERDFPEVEKAVRLWAGEVDVRVDDKKFQLSAWIADPELFEIFDLPFAQGDPQTAFPNPNAIAIAESAAKRLFGNDAPIGKSIDVESNHLGGVRAIAAVLKDVPRNSTLGMGKSIISERVASPKNRNTFGKIGSPPMAGGPSIRISYSEKGSIQKRWPQNCPPSSNATWARRSRAPMRTTSSRSRAPTSIRCTTTIWTGMETSTASINLAR